jgi:hypothetical protein
MTDDDDDVNRDVVPHPRDVNALGWMPWDKPVQPVRAWVPAPAPAPTRAAPALRERCRAPEGCDELPARTFVQSPPYYEGLCSMHRLRARAARRGLADQ